MGFSKQEYWSGLPFPSPRGWYVLDENTVIPQAQQWKVVKVLYETTHYGCEALWNSLQRLLAGKGMKMVWPKITKSCDTCLQNNPRKMPPPSPLSEKEMATYSSVLAWRIPGMVEPGGLPSKGSPGVGHN